MTALRTIHGFCASNHAIAAALEFAVLDVLPAMLPFAEVSPGGPGIGPGSPGRFCSSRLHEPTVSRQVGAAYAK
jgi:hypothetical protein